ncbi:MAG: flagellin [Vampirovibrionales bacterium]|nr:flagellin [Vampirovibrionales bacterium]
MAVANINTNISSLRAVYQMNLSTKATSRTFEQLTTGYRVNRASDDPVGYATAVAMKQDLRSIRQANINAETGVNILGTAESTLGTIQDHLQRMRELAVQAASDTQSASARIAAAMEIRTLADEINRLASSSEFNGQKLMDGTVTNALVQVGTRTLAAGNTVDLTSAMQQANTDLTGGGIGLIDSGGTLTVNSLNSIYNPATGTTALTTGALFRSFMNDIDGALQVVSNRRGIIGALENRLQGVATNLGVYEESLSAAHSAIRDVDIARASSELTQNQVKQNVAQSVLSQINQFDASVVQKLLS